MGEDVCMDCKNWGEEVYWKHFQCTQFCQVLKSGFDRLLEIPQTFSNNLKKKLPLVVTLKGPSGSTWKVGLTTYNGTVFFKYGWEEFTTDHFLQENDLLIFKYDGVSYFDVLIFDGKTLCEKTASYFVRKCGHEEYDGGCRTKRKTGESSSKFGPTSSQDCVAGTTPEKVPNNHVTSPPDDDGGTPPEKSSNNQMVETSVEVPFPSPQEGDGDSPPEKSPTNHIDTSWRGTLIPESTHKKVRREIRFSPVHQLSGRFEEPPTCAEEIEVKPDVNAIHGVLPITSRRPVTEKGKHDALHLAMTALTDEGFMVVMKPTHVYRKFFMSIPSVWIIRHLKSTAKQEIILRMQGKLWSTRFLYQECKHSGGLSSGWRSFVVANNLQEFDVCVFQPATPINNSVVLDVNIFHVT